MTKSVAIQNEQYKENGPAEAGPLMDSNAKRHWGGIGKKKPLATREK